MEYQLHTLQNGIRVLYHPAQSIVSHSCLMINAGARDETPEQEGLAHFIEHLLFKETNRRNTSQILNRLELVGADLNAYTTKEYTCIHASFLNQHLERTIDLFEDIVFHSTFPEEEIEKERGVILDEIASYLDQPEEAVQDDFESLLFKGHPLGGNILGTVNTVKQISKEDIKGFIDKNYNTCQIIFAVSGNYDFKRLIKLCEKYFSHIPANNNTKNRKRPMQNPASTQRESKAISQTHCVIGTQAYPSSYPKKSGLLLVNNLLGGMGMSSRLNLEIREKYGIAYTIESNYIPFTDTGLFTIYFGTDSEKAERAIKLVNKELKKLRENKLGTVQLHQAKQKFTGQIVLAEENRMNLIISMAKSLMDFNHIDSLEDVINKINAVTADDALEISNEILDANQLTTLRFEPTD